MPDIQYIGENLLPRQVGHLAVVLSFVAALLAAISYYFSTKNRNNPASTESWRSIGRWSFGVHGVSVMTVIAMIFYVMINKRYEYFYAHSHVDDNLEFRYIFAAFWEGQEGSFLLWMFWHVGLGAFIILRGRDKDGWESPVVATLASVQVFLASMILGLHFGWGENIIKWGSNPTLLLREANDAPIFAQADYLEKIRGSAKGLNALLQNYWMTIHPPTLFLGFASTTIPFCFAVAGLWTKRYTEWLRPALPYALFSAAILGTGVMMGGMWAYEALSFNGYWAWDPVENMSLVPWLVLVAGIHTHLIARTTGHSLRATAIFYMLTFLLVLYSTFLTRSGILGDTSAHAFTEMGLEWQLVLFQMFYVVLCGYMLFKHYTKMPNPVKEESVSSKEFWMFIGSLVFILSVVFISFTTSIPVYNKVLGYLSNIFHFTPPRLTAPIEPVAHYNKTQLWIGIFIGLISAFTQFLRYKEFNFANYKSTFLKHLGISVGISVLLTGLAMMWIEARAWQYVLLLFGGVFTVVSNIEYAVVFLKRNPKASGSAVAHVGFGLLIIGIMASGINKNWISSNRFAMEGLVDFTEEQFGKYVLVMKGTPLRIKDYEVTYTHDTAYNNKRFVTVDFKRKSPDFKTTLDSFTTHPYFIFDKKSGKMTANNPDTRHYWNKDVFTIANLPPSEADPELARKDEDSLKYVNYNLAINETIFPKIVDKNTPQYQIKIEGLDRNPTHPKYVAEEKDIAIGVKMALTNAKGAVFHAMPLVLLRGDNVYQLPATVNELGIRIHAGSDLFDKIFTPQKDLKFNEYILKEGGSVKVGNKTISIAGVNPNAKPKSFKTEGGDLTLGLKLTVEANGQMYNAEPIYIIRGNTPIPLRDEIQELGMHFVVSKINPSDKTFTLQIAERDPKSMKIPIAIAENAPKTDFIVLEATVNPGINYVWTGCIMMMIGLAMAMFYRIKNA